MALRANGNCKTAWSPNKTWPAFWPPVTCPTSAKGREVLHAQPVNFALDHRTGLGDPRDQIGNRLACDMHLLSVDAAVVQNLIYCIKRCDLELAGIASSAYVSGISSLGRR